jgi:hypothetical protein
MTVVTRNVVDFEDCGVAILNPWMDRMDKAAAGHR